MGRDGIENINRSRNYDKKQTDFSFCHEIFNFIIFAPLAYLRIVEKKLYKWEEMALKIEILFVSFRHPMTW